MSPWSTWAALSTWSQTPCAPRTSRLRGASTGGETARSMTGRKIPSLKSPAEERFLKQPPRQLLQLRRRPPAPPRGRDRSLSRVHGAAVVPGVRWAGPQCPPVSSWCLCVRWPRRPGARSTAAPLSVTQARSGSGPRKGPHSAPAATRQQTHTSRQHSFKSIFPGN